jgi:hypothetical protein
VTAGAPIVNLAAVKVHMGGEKAGEGWQGVRPVVSLFIRSRLIEHHSLLLREICHIVHRDLSTWSVWLLK